MFIIRDAQQQIFSSDQRTRFEHDILRRLREKLPDHYAALGPDQAAEAVHNAVGRAASHGFTVEACVAAYVQMSFVFGTDFDQQPWSQAALDPASHASETDRVSALYQLALAHVGSLIT